MSGRNNDDGGMAIAFAFFIGAFLLLFALIAAVAVFAALIFSFLFFFALYEEYELFGVWFTPDDARTFFGGGIVGGFLLPFFIAFCQLLFQYDMETNLLYWAIGGYTVGSFGTLYLAGNAAQNEAAQKIEVLPPLPRYQPPQQPSRYEEEGKPFEFATWDDEEEMK